MNDQVTVVILLFSAVDDERRVSLENFVCMWSRTFEVGLWNTNIRNCKSELQLRQIAQFHSTDFWLQMLFAV